jgi:hypothetical protein
MGGRGYLVVMAAYRVKTQDLRRTIEIRKRVMANVGKTEVQSANGIARNTKLVSHYSIPQTCNYGLINLQAEGLRRYVAVWTITDSSTLQRIRTSYRASEQSVQKQLVLKQEADSEKTKHVRSHAAKIVIQLFTRKTGSRSCASTTIETELTATSTIRTCAVRLFGYFIENAEHKYFTFLRIFTFDFRSPDAGPWRKETYSIRRSR